MKKSDCEDFKNNGLYDLYIENQLDTDDKQLIEDHLTLCTDCRYHFERIKNMDTFIKDSLHPASIPDLEERLIHAFHKHLNPHSRLNLPLLMKIAACFCFAILTGFIIEKGNSLQEQTLSLNKSSPLATPDESFPRSQTKTESTKFSRKNILSTLGGGRSVDLEPPYARATTAIGSLNKKLDTLLEDGKLSEGRNGKKGEYQWGKDSDKSRYRKNMNGLLGDSTPVDGTAKTYKQTIVQRNTRPRNITNISKGKEIDVLDHDGTADDEIFAEAKDDPDNISQVDFATKLPAKKFDYTKIQKTYFEKFKNTEVEKDKIIRDLRKKYNSVTNKMKQSIAWANTSNQKINEIQKQTDQKLYDAEKSKSILSREKKIAELMDIKKTKKTLTVADDDHKQPGQNQEIQQSKPKPPAPQQPNNPTLKLVRSGNASYEVENYSSTVKRLTRLALENEGYLASESSSRKSNGKLEGSLIFRIKADNFSSFMESLKGIGEVKHHNVRVQDVTKSYFDMESKMESLTVRKGSLLKALEERKGDLKAYVEFESKLAEVLEELNRIKGSLKYLKHQVSFSTLNLTLIETGLNLAAVLIHSEKATMDEAVPDVQTAFVEAKNIAKELKVNILSSKVLRGKTPQATTAFLNFQAKSSQFDNLIKLLSQLGHVSKLERHSDDQAVQGKQITHNASREEGLGTLSLSFYHLPEFVVEKNQLVVWVKSIPEVYRKVSDMTDDNFDISNKEIDSFTEDAKNCRFRININKNSYIEKVAQLRSLGTVHLENGQPILPRTPEGEPLPDFQKQVVQLDISFNTLNPITIQTLDIVLDSENVQRSYHAIKSLAREGKFKIMEQHINDESPRATTARLVYELPYETYAEFMLSLTANKEPLGFINARKSWSLEDTPEKMKNIPYFQTRLARVEINLRKLNPVIVEKRIYLLKVKEDVLSQNYSSFRKIAKSIVGAKLSHSTFNPKQGNVQFSVTVPEEQFSTLVHELTTKAEGVGKFIEIEKWLQEENSDQALSQHAKKIGQLSLTFAAFTPAVIKVSEIKLYSKNPADIIKKASAYSLKNGQLKESFLRTNDDYTRLGNVEVQMEIADYDTFLATFKNYVPEEDIISDKDGANNPEDPRYKNEWKVGQIILNVTNDRKGLLSPAQTGNYFSQIWLTVSNGFQIIMKYLLTGLPFLIFIYLIFLLFRKIYRKQSTLIKRS